MDWEILAYLGAALMVVLALAAYRYWNSTGSYALRMRESHARSLKQRADSSAPAPPDQVENSEPRPAEEEPPGIEKNSETTRGSANEDPGTSAENPGDLPEVEVPQFDEHAHNDSPEQIGRVGTSTAELVRDLDQQLAALPSGIELIDLPILERRRIAERREELLSERRRLLEHSPRGIHRRRRRSREKD